MPKAARSPKSVEEGGLAHWNEQLLRSAFLGENPGAVAALDQGADVDTRQESTGLTALHIAAGTGNLELAQILAEHFDASFVPDRFGRWPTTVAAECKAPVELLDYIVDAEARYLEQQQPTDQ